MLWFCCWMIALRTSEQGLEDRTDWLDPPAWSGHSWGPAASRARSAGALPPLPLSPEMVRWNRWGRRVLREGDIVFRLGDARAARGIFPLSWFIARATGSPFSHTGVVAIEGGSPMVYDCSSDGIRLMPFEVWMLDCVGPLGVKRLRPEFRRLIPGVLGYCREVFEREVPFDFEFRLDDSALYCLEMTEKAFRSQGLILSEPVSIGDWEHLTRYPLTALVMPYATKLAVGRPITLERSVFVPGNDRQGVWASPLLETVFGPEPKWNPGFPGPPGSVGLQGDLELAVLTVNELRRSYSELPVRWMCDVALHPRVRRFAAGRGSDARRASPNADGRDGGVQQTTGRLRELGTWEPQLLSRGTKLPGADRPGSMARRLGPGRLAGRSPVPAFGACFTGSRSCRRTLLRITTSASRCC